MQKLQAQGMRLWLVLVIGTWMVGCATSERGAETPGAVEQARRENDADAPPPARDGVVADVIPRDTLVGLQVPPTYTDATVLDLPVATAQVARGTRAMVVAGHPEASRVGAEILRQGGNAVDAAVATGFALAVTLPRAGNVGGGGFLVIRFPDGTATTFDFRETAPLAATPTMFLDDQGRLVPNASKRGALASGVPGTVAGLLLAHARYGSLPLATLLEPSIRLAADGFVLEARQARRFTYFRRDFEAFPSTAKYFVRRDGRAWAAGDTLRQTDLAAVLQRIRDHGHDGFYRGRTADLIVGQMERSGGIMTHRDLEAYQAIERPALSYTYRDHRIWTMPLPSGGGVLLGQLLAAAEPLDVAAMGWQQPAFLHTSAEAMRRAYADRACFLGDPDVQPVPVEVLLAPDYVARRMRDIRPDTVSADFVPSCKNPVSDAEGTETTHYSVVGPDGMAVSVTTTINDSFGNFLVVDGAGFFLNNEMDDFVTAPGQPNAAGFVAGTANQIAPGKRMLSSMTPVIVEDPQGRLRLVAGSPGGQTIITTMYQLLTALLDFRQPLQVAVANPRFHHQWTPDVLRVEAERFPTPTLEALERRGWRIEPVAAYGAVDAVEVVYGPNGQPVYVGVADPRREGMAAGL